MTLCLHIHVGHGKTGSSFIQSWLAANASLLLERNQIFYPQICPTTGLQDERALQSQFSMGNGFVLNSVIKEGVCYSDQQQWWKRLRCSESVDLQIVKSLIFSHEPWARKLPSQWDNLLQLADVINAQAIHMWLLVRDPLDHAISVYGQMVKRHGFTGSLDDWLLIYDFPSVLMEFLDKVESSQGIVTLRVDHFRVHRQNLMTCLAQWLQLQVDAQWQETHESNVNRSLTLSELTLVRWLNSRNPDLAIRVADNLIQRLPQLSGGGIIPSQKALQHFIQKWHKHIVILNQRLPAHAQLNLQTVPNSVGLDHGESKFQSSTLTREQFDCIFDAFQEF